MEYIGRYAKDDRLEKLRKVLRTMQDSGINTSHTFINNKIATRTAKRLQPVRPAIVVLDCDDEDEDGEEDVADTANLAPEDFEGRDRIRIDLKGRPVSFGSNEGEVAGSQAARRLRGKIQRPRVEGAMVDQACG
jgi:hypothetical protein